MKIPETVEFMTFRGFIEHIEHILNIKRLMIGVYFCFCIEKTAHLEKYLSGKKKYTLG